MCVCSDTYDLNDLMEGVKIKKITNRCYSQHW